MIIATAGHVDHGKTALIRQLTGVETDRLAEEQRRGLSINLGYAYLPRAGDTPLGFIDVPGHQRFINTMISGVSGINMGLLVVAADDGPMPQTYEHLDVLQLLGINYLVVVISKIDRVAPERVADVRAQIDALLTLRPWKNSAFFEVSNIDGGGIEALRNALLQRAQELTVRAAAGHFRLSIDRAFAVKGAGLVVTGTASAGSVSVGELLTLLPQGTELRVRALRVHDQEADTAVAGQRCALNIAGKLEASAITRGDWLVQPGAAKAKNRLDVDFSLLESVPFPLKHLSPIKMHIGAKRLPGRIAFLETESSGNRLQAGESCLAQLILEGDVACFRGERFLLRDHAENVILGGGSILDPNGARSGKSRPLRIAFLNAMKAESPATALAELIAQQQLVNLDRFIQAWNLREDEIGDLSPEDARAFTSEGNRWLVGRRGWDEVDSVLHAYVDQWHAQEPQQAGVKVTKLKSDLAGQCEPPLLMAVLTSRLQRGEFFLTEGRVSKANFKPVVNAEAVAHWQQIEQLLRHRGNRIPLLSEISAQTGIAANKLELVVKAQEKNGLLHRLSEQRYAIPSQLRQLADEVNVMIDISEPITVIAMKTRFDTGRNLTVEILEYFDRIHFTRREGNARVVLDRELPARLFNR